MSSDSESTPGRTHPGRTSERVSQSGNPILTVNAISKQFPLSAGRGGWLTKASGQRATGHWALRQVSFELGRGETLGIMGRNGCGKSTLLEIIAGTVTPTEGTLDVRAEHLAALLELGAGFSPELTGRENVFVYGSLLGMRAREIRERFDEIVDFAELGPFIDEPVKKYSSGMFVRLAFATAISATPEILVIDEALAVGDEAFQRRCFARIEAMKSEGVSMLFVSHAAGTVMELCDRVLLLDQGERLLLGDPAEVIPHYHRLIYAPPERQAEIRSEILAIENPSTTGPQPARSGEPPVESERGAPANGAAPSLGFEAVRFDSELKPKSRLEYVSRGARIESPSIQTEGGDPVNILQRGDVYFICFRVRFEREASSVRPGTLIKNTVGTDLGGIVAAPPGEGIPQIGPGAEIEVRLPFCVRLVPGVYFANVGVVGLVDGEEIHLHRITDALAFRVLDEAASRITGSVDLSTPEAPQISFSEPPRTSVTSAPGDS